MPQQNGEAEHANGTIIEMARSILYAQYFKLEFWAEVIVNRVYTCYQCPTKALESTTPNEAWSGSRPHMEYIRIFGCIAYAMVLDEKKTKLNAKGMKCIFLGYCKGTKVYRLMCIETKKIIKYRDIMFIEDKTSIGNILEMHPSGRNVAPSL